MGNEVAPVFRTTGLLAVDEASDPGVTRTVWTFADSAGTVASTAIYSPETDQWQWYQYRFDSNGKVIQSGGDADPALTSVPIVWRGLRQDAISQLYIAGTTVYDATNARFLSQAGMGDGNPYTLDNNRPSSTSPVLVGKLDVEVRPWLDDYVIDPVAGFSTGVAGVVSFGLTDSLQRKLYRSDIYDVNHTGGAYYLGMAAGVGISIGIGGGAAGVAKVSGLASRAGITAQGLTRGLQAYDVVGAGVGAIQSGYNIATTGQIGLLDAIGFVPAVGYGAGRLRNLRGLASSVDTVAPNRTLHSADGYIRKFVEGTVTEEVLNQVRLVAKGHPTLQRSGFGSLFIDTGTAVDKYNKRLHGIFLSAPEAAVPRGVLAEELQHAIDVASGFHSTQRIAALRKSNPTNFNEIWHQGVFNRIADALEAPQTSIFHFFLDPADAVAFRQAAQGLPR